MKTTHLYTASNNLPGGILLLSLLSTAVISLNFVAFGEVFTAFESQWLNFSNWMSAFMAQPMPA